MVHGRSRTHQAKGLNAELPPRGEKSERLCPFVRDARWVSTISKATASRTASPQTMSQQTRLGSCRPHSQSSDSWSPKGSQEYSDAKAHWENLPSRSLQRNPFLLRVFK